MNIHTRYIAIIVAIILFLSLILIARNLSTYKREKEVCKNFNSQEEAQRKYDKYIDDSNLSKYVKNLDRNHNGKACEGLPSEEIRGLSL